MSATVQISVPQPSAPPMSEVISLEHLKKWINSRKSFNDLNRFMPILHQPKNFVMRFKMYLEDDEATTNTEIINDIQKLDDILSPLFKLNSLLPSKFYNVIISLFDKHFKKEIFEWAIVQRNEELRFIANNATLPNGDPDINTRRIAREKRDFLLSYFKLQKNVYTFDHFNIYPHL